VTSKPDFKVMVLLLVFMQLTRDLFAIAKFLLRRVERSEVESATSRYSRSDALTNIRHHSTL